MAAWTRSGAAIQILYDVVDRRGVLVGRIGLPLNQVIVGFGSRSIAQDELDLQWLERHDWK